jgi:hypothetical protein
LGAGAGTRHLAALAKNNPLVALLAAGLAGAAVHHWRPHEGVGRLLRQVGPPALEAIDRALKERAAAEHLWVESEHTPETITVLHRVAHVLARAPEPTTRTDLLRQLEPDLPGHRHRDLMGGLHRLLQRFPMFHEPTTGHWQVGRVNVGGILTA